jgi:hypothetical protein
MWLDTTNHIDLYDQDEYVQPAVARAADWFEQHLRVPAGATVAS